MSDGGSAGDFPASITVAELDRDPYPVFARLRSEAPVAWVPAVGMWLATCWDEALAVASEPERFAADMPDSPIDRSFGSPTILTCDGPPHRELRDAVDPQLRPRQVDDYIDALVEPIVDRHLDALAARSSRRAELMAELFEPVSVLGLRDILGLSELDADTLRRWFAGLAEGATNFERDPAKQRISDDVCADIDERLDPILTRLEGAPDEGIVSHMLHGGTGAGETRPRERLMPSLKVILLGGMQEPGHGAGSVLLALLSHPEQLDEVRADPDGLLDAAVEEGMRWISPIGTQGRRTVATTTLGGVELPEGRAGGRGDLLRQPRRDAIRGPRRIRHPPAEAARRHVRVRSSLLLRPCLRARARANRAQAAPRPLRRPPPRCRAIGSAGHGLGVPGPAGAARALGLRRATVSG